MHRLLVVMLIGVLAVPVLALSACGGAGGAGMGSPEDARIVLTNVLTAGLEDNYQAARPNLDAVDWLSSLGHPQAAEFTRLPADEQDELVQRFFGMIKQVSEVTTLKDRASMLAAVQAASVDSLPLLKVVRFQFSAPDSERADRHVTVKAKMRYGIDQVWRLSDLETDF